MLKTAENKQKLFHNYNDSVIMCSLFLHPPPPPLSSPRIPDHTHPPTPPLEYSVVGRLGVNRECLWCAIEITKVSVILNNVIAYLGKKKLTAFFNPCTPYPFIMFISRHFERKECLNIKICKWLASSLTNMSISHPLEVVDRGSETQLG